MFSCSANINRNPLNFHSFSKEEFPYVGNLIIIRISVPTIMIIIHYTMLVFI
jgi:hypothetical protein